MRLWGIRMEEKLIKANELLSYVGERLGFVVTKGELLRAIEMQPAVELVRCKDCKYWLNPWTAPDWKHSHGYCHIEECDDVTVGRWDDDFCSYGERKDNDR